MLTLVGEIQCYYYYITLHTHTHTQRLWLSQPCRVYFMDSTILSKGINLWDEHWHQSSGTVIALFPLQARGSSQCLVFTVRSSIPSMIWIQTQTMHERCRYDERFGLFTLYVFALPANCWQWHFYLFCIIFILIGFVNSWCLTWRYVSEFTNSILLLEYKMDTGLGDPGTDNGLCHR